VSFVELRFDTVAGDADAWADALIDAGALSIDVADPQAGTADEAPLYGEPGEPPAAAWPVSRLSALFADGADAGAALALSARLIGLPEPLYETRVIADQDWVRATQAQFAPIRITERLWILPSWCQPVDADAVNLILDPGLAFGTGSHPTTRLCLRWLARQLSPGDTLLDYGCGSGILAVAGARLGAQRVVGTDVDPQAIAASRANAAAHGVAATFVLPDALAAAAPAAFDVVVANILANPLLLLAPALAARVRAGGRLLLSGILMPQADAVIAAYARWFNIEVWQQDEDWVALAGIRRASRARSTRRATIS
jgi:ribosomal protein L11 methyltransferase